MPHRVNVGPITDHELEAVDGQGRPVTLAVAQARATLHHCTQAHARDQFLAKIAVALECEVAPYLTDAGHDTVVRFLRRSQRGRAHIWQRLSSGEISL